MEYSALKDKNVLVLGYAMTGKSVAEYLLKAGAKVTINDRSNLMEDASIQAFIEQGATVIGGEHPLSLVDETVDFIVKNPGIPYSNPLLEKAQLLTIPIYTDVELFAWANPGVLVGITGSNGKTTTTSLVHYIIQSSPVTVHLAGNIGIPTLSVLPEVKADDVVVMELSSFQLMGTEQFKPHIAAMTNIFSAHLDYHGTKEDYVDAKLNLVRNQTEEDFLVYNAHSAEIVKGIAVSKAQKIPFAINNLNDTIRENGAYFENGIIFFKKEVVLNQSDIQIPGEHNIENVLVAVAIAKLLNLSNDTIKAAVRTYYGVPYRIQPLGTFNGVSYFNDSKATNTQATITALKSFEQPLIYIGGGLDRGNEFDELIPYLKYVQAAYLYGESKEKMKRAFDTANVQTVVLCDDLVMATEQAVEKAQAGQVVLFSPSCASWDQFKNYEERGALFTEHVLKLNK
ncbi:MULTISPECIES: UDP-N-acetylmuramoyl-L-alanine--D-glutamate ligase [unclassified Facklamia]|uniref:UDP-N-acetylmuramoyl-L-alanine--D-glutamate ligase n=1 Tax=Aerococcaceae TaxID=186827 RepID=UPI0013B6F303|nr:MULTISPECIES: UDP-N-acetylmuramoyl-L-alanine--D-glutamate ligase [unclassified Facklamia]NEW65229.1 UDP-N-acetylmuramoyl-L-alanine--D-glutamate ligase [Facklamia sp. 252]NEW65350.1 UDP-N-acetylmuramoyl-L-alanine--D-glutamate ligase [Facklamia sp. 252]NEW68370.1 UDP-N-acetylmuramoyl-L-alanine--D-glutamate ligase [Facklamia sp. 253]QQD66188.1 UDP-N-acetylmuramoyl-L-alanine--D-glutamate ligase [Aerococcaceae bacterium zg-252]